MQSEIFATLISSVAVIIVVAYMVTRSRFYSGVITGKISNINRFYLILIFGAFSIYGTLSGFKVGGAIANIRDLGPAIAGLIAGPLVGTGAGLIGGIHRYFQGGLTCEPCSISTVVAGLAGGLVYLTRKGKPTSIRDRVVFMVGVEVFHMGLTLLMSRPFDEALAVVKKIIIPMVVANGAGMGIYTFIIGNLIRERSVEAERQMIEGELKAAREIQMGIVPRLFPPFPDWKEFDISAVLEPAKEVGGDFYDFFFIDDDRLFFVIGDVSGKGVPASLFMAVTITLLRTTAMQGINAGKILENVNNALSRENTTSMFVTVFCGILNIRTGNVEYSNAGHNPPFIVRKDRRIEELTGNDLVLAAMEDTTYRTMTASLGTGDVIFHYTDGVTEAMDKAGNFFTNARLDDALKETMGMSASEMVNTTLSKIHEFASGADQSDDITIMAIRYTNIPDSISLS